LLAANTIGGWVMAEQIGYTTGVYDMFHIGHLNVLRRASRECDRLIVGVTTDELSESRKGKRPIVPLEERIDIIRAVSCVDEVVAQTSMDKFQAWEEHQFNVMFVGDDWKGTPAWDRLENEFALRGVRLVYFPYTKQISSTALRTKVFGA
jgi:glycerol-3-phosphate cytidylyltransferase